MPDLSNGTQVAVDNTGGGTLLIAASSSRRGLVLAGIDGTAYIGVEGVDGMTGIPLLEGDVLTFTEMACPSNEVYAFSETTATVFVTEVNDR